MGEHGVPIGCEHGVLRTGEHGVPRMVSTEYLGWVRAEYVDG